MSKSVDVIDTETRLRYLGNKDGQDGKVHFSASDIEQWKEGLQVRKLVHKRQMKWKV